MIIVYGGSFNPPTLAHLRLARLVLAEPTVRQVIWVPVGNRYDKPGLIDCHDRIAMCREMLIEETKMSVSEIECQRAVAQGTYFTLKAIQQEYSNHQIAFLIGADHLATLSRWIEARRLLMEFSIWVLPRPGYSSCQEQPLLQEFSNHLHYLSHFPQMPISASSVREWLAQGKRPTDQVHPKVLEYINQKRLYGV